MYSELSDCDALDREHDFDLDVRIHIAPGWSPDKEPVHASGSCGGCPKPTEVGSTCTQQGSCPPTCGYTRCH